MRLVVSVTANPNPWKETSTKSAKKGDENLDEEGESLPMEPWRDRGPIQARF